MDNIEIIPAVLETKFIKIQEKLKKLEPYFDKVQIDIGDGKFVSDKFGCIDKLREFKTKILIEVHLMTEKPWEDLEFLKNENIKKITFHYESFLRIPKKTRSFAINNLIKRIKEMGMKVGIAINPETGTGFIADYLERIDEVLLLSVVPGKQGQKFEEEVLSKVRLLRNIKEDLTVGVDGGISDKNIEKIIDTGINKAYIGSFLWKEGSLESLLRKLKIEQQT